MDKKSKALTIVFFVMLTASAVATFYRYVVVKDINFYTDEESFNQSLIDDQEEMQLGEVAGDNVMEDVILETIEQ